MKPIPVDYKFLWFKLFWWFNFINLWTNYSELILAILIGLFGNTSTTLYSQESRDLMNVTSQLLAGIPQLIQQLAPALLNTMVEMSKHKQECSNRTTNGWMKTGFPRIRNLRSFFLDKILNL